MQRTGSPKHPERTLRHTCHMPTRCCPSPLSCSTCVAGFTRNAPYRGRQDATYMHLQSSTDVLPGPSVSKFRGHGVHCCARPAICTVCLLDEYVLMGHATQATCCTPTVCISLPFLREWGGAYLGKALLINHGVLAQGAFQHALHGHSDPIPAHIVDRLPPLGAVAPLIGAMHGQRHPLAFRTWFREASPVPLAARAVAPRLGACLGSAVHRALRAPPHAFAITPCLAHGAPPVACSVCSWHAVTIRTGVAGCDGAFPPPMSGPQKTSLSFLGMHTCRTGFTVTLIHERAPMKIEPTGFAC